MLQRQKEAPTKDRDPDLKNKTLSTRHQEEENNDEACCDEPHLIVTDVFREAMLFCGYLKLCLYLMNEKQLFFWPSLILLNKKETKEENLRRKALQ